MNLRSAIKQHRLLKQSPHIVEHLVVKPIRAADESGVASRLMGLLSRLRMRTA